MYSENEACNNHRLSVTDMHSTPLCTYMHAGIHHAEETIGHHVQIHRSVGYYRCRHGTIVITNAHYAGRLVLG